MTDQQLDKVCGATDGDQQRDAFDDWAVARERDICALGYRLPAHIGAVFAAHVPSGAAPMFQTMPYGEPAVRNRVHVHEVLRR